MIRRASWLILILLTDATVAAVAAGGESLPPSSAILGPPLATQLGSPPAEFVDLDKLQRGELLTSSGASAYADPSWGCYLLPEGLIYRSYLAGPKESRMATAVTKVSEDSTMWDSTLGARLGLLRIGSGDPIRPRGFQVDVEGSAQLRLDWPEERDVRSADFRVGVPFTWGDPWQQWKFAYYHISSHLGDEFLLKNPGFPVFGQARDALVLGYSRYLTDWIRVYAETGWAFYCNASEPWEFQFGLDLAPRNPTGLYGAPFFAINAHLRQELDFGGGVNTQIGWAWRSDMTAHLLRFGFQYYNGASPQYAFLPYHEQQFSVALWYDF